VGAAACEAVGSLIELDGVGHRPQLDVPRETAELIAGFTAR
jgi:hypothetical protein